MNLDIINGLFELLGSAMVWLNVRQLYIDKQVKGVVPGVTLFFFAWGMFNLVYYPALGQWFSFWGGLSIVLANAVWLGLTVKYRATSTPLVGADMAVAGYEFRSVGFRTNPDTGVLEYFNERIPLDKVYQ